MTDKSDERKAVEQLMRVLDNYESSDSDIDLAREAVRAVLATAPFGERKALEELVALIEKRRWTCTWKGSEDEPAVERAKAVLATAPAEPPKDAAHSMGRAVTNVLNGAKSLPEHLRRDYFTGIATIVISIMHGTYGREFAAGFLHDATQSLDDPTAVTFREPSKQ